MQINLTAVHRRQLQQRPSPLRHSSNATLQHILHPTGQHRPGQRHLPNLAQIARFGGQGTHHLYHEKRVAFGLLLQQIAAKLVLYPPVPT
jgi:hypothetical protein